MRLANVLESAWQRYQSIKEPGWALASQILTSGGNFATTIILIRASGLIEFGRFSIAFITLMILRNFLNGVVLTPMSAIAPKLRGTTANAYRGFLFANGLLFSFGTSVLLFAISGLLGLAIGATWLVSIALPLALANFAANAADFFRRYQFVKSMPVSAFMIDLIRYGVQLPAMVWVAFASPVQLGADLALYLLAAGSAFAAVFGLILYGKTCWRPMLNRFMWPRHWNFVKWMTVAIGLESIQANLALFAGSAILGESSMAIARAIQQASNILNIPVNGMQNFALARSSTILKNHGYPKFEKYIKNLSLYMLAFNLVVSVLVLVFRDIVVEDLLKIESKDAGIVLGIYLVINLALVVRLSLRTALQTLEAPSHITRANLLGTVLACLSLLIIPFIGVVGIPLTNLIIVAAIIIMHRQSLAALRKPNVEAAVP